MIENLKEQVARLCSDVNDGEKQAAELLRYLQYLLRDSNITKEVDKSQHYIAMNNRQMAADLTEMKRTHRELEAKYKDLVMINFNNEKKILRLNEELRLLNESLNRISG